MDKLLHSRLFRCLVCLVLVCCILVNISPLKAESTEIAAASVPFFGMVLWYMFMSSGVVFEPTNDVLNQLDKQGQVVIGEALDKLDEAQALAAEDEFRKSVVDRMYFSDDFDFPEDDYDDGYQDDEVPDWGIKSGENHNLILGSSLGMVLANWVYDAIMDDQVEVEEEVPDYSVVDGEAVSFSVNGASYSCTANFPFSLVGFTGSTSDQSNHFSYVYGFSSTAGYLYCSTSSGSNSLKYRTTSYTDVCYYNVFTLSGGGGPYEIDGNFPVIDMGVVDINTFSGNCIEYGCQLLVNDGKITVPVLPDTYFGEIPDQVKAGNYDSSNIQFPDYNFSDSIVSEQAAQQQMQDIYNQVVNNQMSYEDFMQQVQAVPPVGPVDPTPTPSEPGETTPDETQPEEDDTTAQKKFTVDLSDFFPFCIPKDIGAFLAALIATPVAPKFHWVLQDLSGRSYNIDIDLSPWDGYAKLFRDLQVALFILGLALKTKDLIQW